MPIGHQLKLLVIVACSIGIYPVRALYLRFSALCGSITTRSMSAFSVTS